MRTRAIFTRHLTVWAGPDHQRKREFSITLVAFRRAEAPLFELDHRLNVSISFSKQRPFVITRRVFIPAWQDEPTVVAEYERTMRT